MGCARTGWTRAWCTAGPGIKARAHMRARHGHGGAKALAVEWLRHGCREPRNWRAQNRGGPGGKNERNENDFV